MAAEPAAPIDRGIPVLTPCAANAMPARAGLISLSSGDWASKTVTTVSFTVLVVVGKLLHFSPSGRRFQIRTLPEESQRGQTVALPIRIHSFDLLQAVMDRSWILDSQLTRHDPNPVLTRLHPQTRKWAKQRFDPFDFLRAVS